MHLIKKFAHAIINEEKRLRLGCLPMQPGAVPHLEEKAGNMNAKDLD